MDNNNNGIVPFTIIRVTLGSGTNADYGSMTCLLGYSQETTDPDTLATSTILDTMSVSLQRSDYGDGYVDVYMPQDKIKVGDVVSILLVAIFNDQQYGETTYGTNERKYTAGFGVDKPETPTVVWIKKAPHHVKVKLHLNYAYDLTAPYDAPNILNYYAGCEMWSHGTVAEGWDGSSGLPDEPTATGWSQEGDHGLKALIKQIKNKTKNGHTPSRDFVLVFNHKPNEQIWTAWRIYDTLGQYGNFGNETGDVSFTRPGTPSRIKLLKGLTTETKKFYKVSLNKVETPGTSSETDNTKLKRKYLEAVEVFTAPVGTDTLTPLQLSGTVSVANGAKAVVGLGTHFLAECMVGDAIMMVSSGTPTTSTATYGVLSVEDDTHLTIDDSFGGTTISGGTIWNGWPDTNATLGGADEDPLWEQQEDKVIKGPAAAKGFVRVAVQHAEGEHLTPMFRLRDQSGATSPWAQESDVVGSTGALIKVGRKTDTGPGVWCIDLTAASPAWTKWANPAAGLYTGGGSTNPHGIAKNYRGGYALVVAQTVYSASGMRLFRYDVSGAAPVDITPVGYYCNSDARMSISICQADGLTVYGTFYKILDATTHVLRSADGGFTWTERATSSGLYCLACPSDPNSVYLLDYLGGIVYHSGDGGNTFGAALGVGPGASIQVDWNNSLILYICHGNGFFIGTVTLGSPDTISLSANLAQTNTHALASVQDPTDPLTIYYVGGDNATGKTCLCKTTKGQAVTAADWTKALGPTGSGIGYDITIDPNNPQWLFLSMINYTAGSVTVLYSSDRGATLLSAPAFPGADYMDHLESVMLCFLGSFGPSGPDKQAVLGIGYNAALTPPGRKVSETMDWGASFGDTWNSPATMSPVDAQLVIPPGTDTIVRIDGGENLYAKFSQDGAESWDVLCSVRDKYVKALFGSTTNVCYLVAYNTGDNHQIIRSLDWTVQPRNWIRIGYTGKSVKAACMDTDAHVWLLLTDGSVTESTNAMDATPTWSAPIATGFNADMALDIFYDGTTLWVVGTRDAAHGQNFVLAGSADAGITWVPADGSGIYADPSASITEIDQNSLYIDPTTPTRMFLSSSAGSNGIWRTTDGALTWTQVYSTSEVYCVVALVDLLGGYMAGSKGLWLISRDYGVTWIATEDNPGATTTKWLALVTKMWTS